MRFPLLYKAPKEKKKGICSPTHIFENTEVKQWLKQSLQLYHPDTYLK